MWLYGKIANARNALYEKGLFKSFSLGAPAISIGNITAGGTGKTPLVAFVAEILAERGEKVCILTRGYGRENANQRVLVSDGEKILADVRAGGDEPLELANKLPGKAIIIVADANRVAAANWARDEFGVTAFVLDDAFQHRRAKRDLDIVTIDATNPFGGGKNFLREPLENLKRAGAIVITCANLIENIESLIAQIAKYNSDCPIFTVENKIADLIELENVHAKAQSSQRPKTEDQRPFLAFCALGNPDNFFEQLKQEGFNLVSTKKFSDHHFYTQKDIANLEGTAKQTGAEMFVTTGKDAVKLKDLSFELPCYIAMSEIIFDDEKKLRDLIAEARTK